MNVNELRLGNVVKTSTGCFSVYAISAPMPNKDERFNDKAVITLWGYGLFDVTEDMIEPVPLTEELILIHDFKKSEMDLIPEVTIYEKEVDGKLIELSMFDDGNWYAHIDDEWRSTIGGCFVSSMHELQNLCALCGIEKVFKSC